MVKKHPSGFTKKQISELEKLLIQKLESLVQDIHLLERDLKQDGASAEQGAPDDLDRSAFEEGMQRSQLVLSGKFRLRSEIEYALKKVSTDEFGICEESEEPIAFERLKAQPWTRYSLEAQTDLEREMRIRGNARVTSEAFSAF